MQTSVIRGLAVEGPIGDLIDPTTQVLVTLRFRARVTARILDPATSTDALSSSLGSALRSAMSSTVSRAIETGETTLQAVTGGPLAQNLAGSLLAESNAITRPLGIALDGFDELRIFLSEEDQAAVAQAAAEVSGYVAGGAGGAAFEVGDSVQARWSDGSYYRARVSQRNGDMFLVVWEDGSDPSWVPPDHMQALVSAPPVPPGAPHVRAQWTDGRYYGARVVASDRGLHQVVWDDGSPPLWLRPDQILPSE